ncbi:hypothetical protein GWI33_014321 [Rhynchophorus ferrugineus]|uniref:Uncharacterized protein n=1 Tax=Rhynchophorus ferrugineus TaxID=354439 RepID=A0A834I595_RHYFE|nr:hypothetical protein GWI33_014321 [Rhynchophorus ferrugineus]
MGRDTIDGIRPGGGRDGDGTSGEGLTGSFRHHQRNASFKIDSFGVLGDILEAAVIDNWDSGYGEGHSRKKQDH